MAGSNTVLVGPDSRSLEAALHTIKHRDRSGRHSAARLLVLQERADADGEANPCTAASPHAQSTCQFLEKLKIPPPPPPPPHLGFKGLINLC